MATPPPLTPPRSGDLINPELAYVKRISAVRQAAAWNAIIRDDPVLGPASGCLVGVGAQRNGRYPLVWSAMPDVPPAGGADT